MKWGKSDLIFSQEVKNQRWAINFRCAVGLFSLIHFASFAQDYLNIVTNEKFLSRELHDLLADDLVITFYDLSSWLPGISVSLIVYSWLGVYITALALMIFNKFPRVSSIVSMLTHITIVYSFNMFTYGVDYFTSIALFYCAVIPVTPSSSRGYLTTIQIHFMFLYFISGFSKAIGFPWRDGESIYRALALHNNLGLVEINDFGSLSWLFPIVGWTVFLIELLFPFFTLIKRTTRLWVFATISMHMGILLGLGLIYFSVIMIIFNYYIFIAPYHQTGLYLNRQRVAL